jgi:hypothetical protein
MFIILTSSHDRVLADILRQSGISEIGMLTCRDLSVPGWNLYLQDVEKSTAVIEGKLIKLEEIKGIWNRLPFVTEHELDHILPSERKYIASEMMAFLVAWLSLLRCPMINIPTPTCLSGPNWNQLQWACAAFRTGISIYPLFYYLSNNNSRFEGQKDSEYMTTVTVIGRRCFGSDDKELLNKTKCLANLSDTDFLSVTFNRCKNDEFFVNANPCPYYITDDTLGATIKYLEEGIRGVL